MLYFFLTIFSKNTHRLFVESQYDPLLKDSSNSQDASTNELSEISGFFSNHEAKIPSTIQKFGELSILSINFYKQILDTSKIEETVNNLIKLIDSSHPSLIAVQGISPDELALLKNFIEADDHYVIVNTDKAEIDSITGQHYFLPIIVDLRLVQVIKPYYFLTNEDVPQPYASYVTLSDKRVKDHSLSYTFVNIDLFSSFSEVVSAEFFGIIEDIIESKEVGDRPVFLAGNIGNLPINVKKEIEISFKNLIQEDKNNHGLSKTTDHTNGNNDDIERNFILLRDPKNEFIVNYARILSEFEEGNNYPLYSILSFSSTVDKNKDEHNGKTDEKDKKNKDHETSNHKSNESEKKSEDEKKNKEHEKKNKEHVKKNQEHEADNHKPREEKSVSSEKNGKENSEKDKPKNNDYNVVKK
ncbi:hypothetical protein GVAV_001747 [Gurleya vavrai]